MLLLKTFQFHSCKCDIHMSYSLFMNTNINLNGFNYYFKSDLLLINMICPQTKVKNCLNNLILFVCFRNMFRLFSLHLHVYTVHSNHIHTVFFYMNSVSYTPDPYFLTMCSKPLSLILNIFHCRYLKRYLKIFLVFEKLIILFIKSKHTSRFPYICSVFLQKWLFPKRRK